MRVNGDEGGRCGLVGGIDFNNDANLRNSGFFDKSQNAMVPFEKMGEQQYIDYKKWVKDSTDYDAVDGSVDP